MTSVDRIQGLSGQQAIKTPVRVTTTAAITLSGEQTIDGVAVVEDDRVLVKDQADTTANGIYDVSTSSWTRSLDFDGANDITDGTMVLVSSGTTYADKVFKLNATDPIVIGTTALTFNVATDFTSISAFAATLLDDANAAAARSTLGLVIGTDVQAQSATLRAIADQTEAANKVQYYTADNTPGLLDFKDEDNMASDSATAVPSQQSVKAYVDAAVVGVAGSLTAGIPLVLNPYTQNTTTTQAHGLGAAPAFCVTLLECLSSDNGWTAGDVIEVPTLEVGGTNSGFVIERNAMNVVLYTPTVSIPGRNKSTRANVNLTDANWKVTITPYKLN